MKSNQKSRGRKPQTVSQKTRRSSPSLQSTSTRLSSLGGLNLGSIRQNGSHVSSTFNRQSSSRHTPTFKPLSVSLSKRTLSTQKPTALASTPVSIWTSLAAFGSSIFSSTPSTRYFASDANDLAKPNDINTRYKRLLYQSQQRGWLELDMIIGTYVRENREKLMNEKSLEELTKVTDLDNNDLIRWLIEGKPVSDEMKQNKVFMDILDYTTHPNKSWIRKEGNQ